MSVSSSPDLSLQINSEGGVIPSTWSAETLNKWPQFPMPSRKIPNSSENYRRKQSEQLLGHTHRLVQPSPRFNHGKVNQLHKVMTLISE